MLAKVLRRINTEESDNGKTNSSNKENIDSKAAVVIQSRKIVLYSN